MLFKSTPEIKLYVPAVTSSFKFDSAKSTILTCELDYIKKIMGSTFYTAFENKYQNDDLNANELKLLPYIQRALASLAFYHFVPKGSVQLVDGGIVTSSAANSVSASAYKVEAFRDECFIEAFKCMEQLIEYLVENKASFSDYTAGEGYAEATECFINSATDFSKYFDIKNSRWIFWNVKSIMKRLEEDKIKPSLGETLYSTLKTQVKNNTVSIDNQKILPYIKHALAQLTIMCAIDEMGLTIDHKGISVYTSGTTNAMLTDLKNPAPNERMVALKKYCREIGYQKISELDTFLYSNYGDYAGYNTEVYEADEPGEFNNEKGSGFYKM